jgi:hypothetical protein
MGNQLYYNLCKKPMTNLKRVKKKRVKKSVKKTRNLLNIRRRNFNNMIVVIGGNSYYRGYWGSIDGKFNEFESGMPCFDHDLN